MIVYSAHMDQRRRDAGTQAVIHKKLQIKLKTYKFKRVFIVPYDLRIYVKAMLLISQTASYHRNRDDGLRET